ncbi:hypothetical protein D3C72_2456380 [compost metagenome]
MSGRRTAAKGCKAAPIQFPALVLAQIKAGTSRRDQCMKPSMKSARLLARRRLQGALAGLARVRSSWTKLWMIAL